MEEVWKMVMRNEGQALCVAMEMERRAIRVYERALMLTDDPQVQTGIRAILRDEQEHLRRFTEMRACHGVDPKEEGQLLAALGAEALFPGGVMEMKREHALDTLNALYRYAADSEADAVQKYAEFANKCGDEKVRDAFLEIVREESQHLTELRQKIEEE